MRSRELGCSDEAHTRHTLRGADQDLSQGVRSHSLGLLRRVRRVVQGLVGSRHRRPVPDVRPQRRVPLDETQRLLHHRRLARLTDSLDPGVLPIRHLAPLVRRLRLAEHGLDLGVVHVVCQVAALIAAALIAVIVPLRRTRRAPVLLVHHLAVQLRHGPRALTRVPLALSLLPLGLGPLAARAAASLR